VSGSGPPPALRRRVFELLDQGSTEPLGTLIDRVLIGLILLNVGASVLDSVPSVAERFGTVLMAVEIVSVAAFTIEYLVRLWCAPEHSLEEQASAWRARLAYALTPSALIDLLSVAPVYVALLIGVDLRSLLVLRLLRFFKLARYSPGLESLIEAISTERRALTACGVILLGTVLISASAMRFAEAEAQPDKFGTVPDAMYWAFITLATVGYGDVVPVTPLGKVIASVTAVVGIIMLALPVGLLASAFADEIRRRDFVVTLTMVAKVPLFADLEASEVAGIMRFLQARSFESGNAIFQRGDPAHAMFFISSGMVEVELKDNPIRLHAGDFFGEIGLLHGRERSATVMAVSRVRLLVLQAADLKHLMERTPLMAERLHEVAGERAEAKPRLDPARGADQPGGHSAAS